MTEEEKKAIEKIKELEKLTREESKERNLKETQKLYKEYADYYLIILNLIEKLQKENGELKENERYMKDVFGEKICTLKDDKERFKRYGIQKQEEIKELKSNSIPKDKIREKMQEIMNYTYSTADERHNQDYAYDRLKELLEEE